MLKTVSAINGFVSPTFSGNVTLSNGNLIIGTSGKGIDFSATAGTGTSELLSDYEEGTWTPVDASGAGLTLTVANAFYTKIGRQVIASAQVSYPVTVDGSAAAIGGLPFVANASGNFSGSIENNAGLGAAYLLFGSSSTLLVKQSISILGGLSNANLSNALVLVTATYIV
jgi:hypothetical protein